VAVVRVSARVACLWVPAFEAAAAERCEPALTERPLAVVRGTPPATRVVGANAVAREQGVAAGMTEASARARCPALVTRAASEAQVAAARHALLEAALAVSPRLEDAAPGVVFADVAGLRGLIGDDAAVGERLVRQARRVGMTARAAIAGTRAAARIAVRALAHRDPVVVVPPGGEAQALARTPVTVLSLSEEIHAALARWGVRTLGELAALPRAGLADRLGAAGLRAHDLARGIDREPWEPWEPPPFWEEAQGLDWEIADLAALVAVLRQLLERLTARLLAGHVSTDQLGVRLALASGERQERRVALAYPMADVAAMMALLRLDLEAHPPPAAVTAVALAVRPVRARPGQGGLWQPPAPIGRDLAALLARLVELAGEDNVGSPIPDDSHRPDAYTLRPFTPDASERSAGDLAAGESAGEHALALRRLRPSRAVVVAMERGRPSRVEWGDRARRVMASAGPWRLSGEWWDTRGWARDEWDLLLGDGTLCRLAHDRVSGTWQLDGIYD
jgi:protein ImuB